MFISIKYFVLYWFKFFSTNFLRQVLPFIFRKIFSKIFQPEIDLLDTVNKNNFFREHNNHIFSRPFVVRITLANFLHYMMAAILSGIKKYYKYRLCQLIISIENLLSRIWTIVMIVNILSNTRMIWMIVMKILINEMQT